MLRYKANLHMLLHSADIVERLVEDRLAPLALRPRQALVLEGLSRMGRATQVQLADEFGVRPASVSTMLERLEASGYVTRRRNPQSSRSNLIELSEKGEGLVSQIYAVWREVDDELAERLGPDKARDFTQLHRALRDAFGARVPGQQNHPDPQNSEGYRL